MKNFLYNVESNRGAIVYSTFINGIARFIGYFKYILIIYFFGFSRETDTFFLALVIIDFFLITTDAFDSIGVPNLVKAKAHELEFTKLASRLLTLTLFLALTLSAVIIGVLPVIWYFLQHNSIIDSHALILHIPILTCYLFSTLLFHHFGAILRAQRKFLIFSLGELFGSIIVLILIFVGLRLFKTGIILSTSIAIGQVSALLFVMSFCRSHLFFSWSYDFEMKNIVKQFFQLSIIYATASISSIFNKLFALGLPLKNITALAYGSMVALVPRSIVKIENILLVSLSEKGINEKKIRYYSYWILLIFTGIAVIFYVESQRIMMILFGHGKVSGLDIQLAAAALRGYVVGLPFLALASFYYRVFQLLNRLRIIAIVGVCGAMISLILNMYFISHNYGILGLALATSITNIFLASVYLIMILLQMGGREAVAIKEITPREIV